VRIENTDTNYVGRNYSENAINSSGGQKLLHLSSWGVRGPLRLSRAKNIFH